MELTYYGRAKSLNDFASSIEVADSSAWYKHLVFGHCASSWSSSSEMSFDSSLYDWTSTVSNDVYWGGDTSSIIDTTSSYSYVNYGCAAYASELSSTSGLTSVTFGSSEILYLSGDVSISSILDSSWDIPLLLLYIEYSITPQTSFSMISRRVGLALDGDSASSAYTSVLAYQNLQEVYVGGNLRTYFRLLLAF